MPNSFDFNSPAWQQRNRFWYASLAVAQVLALIVLVIETSVRQTRNLHDLEAEAAAAAANGNGTSAGDGALTETVAVPLGGLQSWTWYWWWLTPNSQATAMLMSLAIAFGTSASVLLPLITFSAVKSVRWIAIYCAASATFCSLICGLALFGVMTGTVELLFLRMISATSSLMLLLDMQSNTGKTTTLWLPQWALTAAARIAEGPSCCSKGSKGNGTTSSTTSSSSSSSTNSSEVSSSRKRGSRAPSPTGSSAAASAAVTGTGSGTSSGSGSPLETRKGYHPVQISWPPGTIIFLLASIPAAIGLSFIVDADHHDIIVLPDLFYALLHKWDWSPGAWVFCWVAPLLGTFIVGCMFHSRVVSAIRSSNELTSATSPAPHGSARLSEPLRYMMWRLWGGLLGTGLACASITFLDRRLSVILALSAEILFECFTPHLLVTYISLCFDAAEAARREITAAEQREETRKALVRSYLHDARNPHGAVSLAILELAEVQAEMKRQLAPLLQQLSGKGDDAEAGSSSSSSSISASPTASSTALITTSGGSKAAIGLRKRGASSAVSFEESASPLRISAPSSSSSSSSPLLQSPMTSLRRLGELLEEGNELLTLATRSGGQLSKLLDSLLQQQALDSGAFSMELRPMTIEALFDEALAQLQPRLLAQPAHLSGSPSVASGPTGRASPRVQVASLIDREINLLPYKLGFLPYPSGSKLAAPLKLEAAEDEMAGLSSVSGESDDASGAGSAGFSSSSELPPALLLGDGFRLLQCVSNLLTNASKFTNRRISLESQLLRVSIDDATSIEHRKKAYKAAAPASVSARGGARSPPSAELPPVIALLPPRTPFSLRGKRKLTLLPPVASASVHGSGSVSPAPGRARSARLAFPDTPGAPASQVASSDGVPLPGPALTISTKHRARRSSSSSSASSDASSSSSGSHSSFSSSSSSDSRIGADSPAVSHESFGHGASGASSPSTKDANGCWFWLVGPHVSDEESDSDDDDDASDHQGVRPQLSDSERRDRAKARAKRKRWERSGKSKEPANDQGRFGVMAAGVGLQAPPAAVSPAPAAVSEGEVAITVPSTAIVTSNPLQAVHSARDKSAPAGSAPTIVDDSDALPAILPFAVAPKTLYSVSLKLPKDHQQYAGSSGSESEDEGFAIPTAAIVTIRLVVKDDGPGIPRNKQQQLFKSFSQIPSATAASLATSPSLASGLGLASTPGVVGERGFGLGLSILSQLGKKHGAKISFLSKEGIGSAFAIDVPFRLCLRAPAAAKALSLVVPNSSFPQASTPPRSPPLFRGGLSPMSEAKATAPGSPALPFEVRHLQLRDAGGSPEHVLAPRAAADSADFWIPGSAGALVPAQPAFLIVDDEAVNLRLLSKQLKRHFPSVALVEASNGQELLDAFDRHRIQAHPANSAPASNGSTQTVSSHSCPSLVSPPAPRPLAIIAVISDFSMPVLSGPEAVFRLRKSIGDEEQRTGKISLPCFPAAPTTSEPESHVAGPSSLALPSRPRLRVIGMSGNALHDDVQRFLRSGADVCFPKPIDIKALISELSRAKEEQEHWSAECFGLHSLHCRHVVSVVDDDAAAATAARTAIGTHSASDDDQTDCSTPGASS